MRNKLKRSTSENDKTCQSKDPAQTKEVTTILSGSSSSEEETPPETGSASLAAIEKCGSNSASAVKTVQQQQERSKSRCANDVKVAPIFLCSSLQRRRQGSRGGEPCPPLQKEQESRLPSLSDESQKVKGQQTLSTSKEQLSPSAVNICLGEIQTSNPTFPVHTVFSSLQRKAREGLQHVQPTEVSPCPGPPQNHIKEKRKRGNDIFEMVSKRQRCSFTSEAAVGADRCHMPAQDVKESVVLLVKKHARRSKLSRTHRLRHQTRSSAGLVSNWELKSEGITNQRESASQTSISRGSSFEDVLWTDKYSPQNSREVIGNSVPVNTLCSWLKKWKLRADAEERKKTEEWKQEENSNDSWDCGDFQGEAGTDDVREESLCNTMLITGPPGVGKTASVYACARELGFKVFEVNCSSQRSGRHVLSQLKEATQSHLVETSEKDPLKPAYFTSFTSHRCVPKSENLPGNTVQSKNVISTTRRRAKQRSGRSGHIGKANPATVTLANYFKTKVKADHLQFGNLSTRKINTKKLSKPSPACDTTAPRSKKTATSLILFEEVDVIFDDDVGFLAAIKTFMTTTKRPVILTTSDPSFRERFSYSLEEIHFKTPAAVTVCSYLQLVGLAEKVKLRIDDLNSLLRFAQGDVRRCLLQLELWVRSRGGQDSLSGGLLKGPSAIQYSDADAEGGSLYSKVSPCETGCTASMLGFDRVSKVQLLNYLKSRYWSETDMNQFLMLLAESWRRCVPLLYSNLELLLPIRAYESSVHCQKRMIASGLQTKTGTSDIDLDTHQLNGNVILKAINSKNLTKTYNRLSRKKYNMCANTSLFSIKQRPEVEVKTDFLVALTNFFDLISYLDATLPAKAPVVSGSCRPDAFYWTGAEIKDGLLNERSEADGMSWSQEKMLNIQAAVEGLGYHKCYWQLSEAWTKAQKYGHTMEDKTEEGLGMLPAASKTQSLSFIFQPLCEQSVVQRRYELSRAVFGSKSFSLLGNRRAVCVDYMPILRSICRFQRAQQQKEEPVRYKNFLTGTHLGLSRSTMKVLAEDFS